MNNGTPTPPAQAAQTGSGDRRQIYKRVGIISFFTLLSRILGAARDLVLVNVFGASYLHDAYVVAQTIPNALRRLTAEGSMTLALVPVYTDIREEQGMAQARLFARKALGLILFATVFLTLIGIWYSDALVYLFASGYANDPVKFDITVLLTQIMFPYLIMVSLVAWAMGVLNAEGRFAAPAAAPIFLNVGIIFGALVIALWIQPPVLGLAVGMLFGGVMQVVLQWPSLRAVGQSIVPSGFWRDANVRKLLRLLAPSLLGVAVYEVNLIVLRTIASSYPEGQMTYYYISSRLTELVVGLFAFAFASASFPDLSKHTAHAQWEKMLDTIRFAISGSMFVIIPASLALIIVAEPIVKMLYLHGRFTLADAETTVSVLQAFAVGVPAITMTRILLPAYYSLKDAKTPVLAFFFTVLVTAGAGYGLGLYYQVVGLGLGLSLGACFQAAMLYVLLKRKAQAKGRVMPYGDMAKYTLLGLMASGVAYAVSLLGTWNLGPHSLGNWACFIGLIGAAVTCYLAALVFSGDPHMRRLVKLIRSRI